MTTHCVIGDFQVHADQRRVLRDGQAQPLGARAFDLLLALIERRDRVVGKEELLAIVWPGVVVEENNLTVQVSALRKLLGTDAIATVAGRGYRFTMSVQPQPDSAQAASAPPTASLASLAPPAAVVGAPDTPTNLPAERSTFIGRAQELQNVRDTMAKHRLVTLTGIGGSGKTRLALRVGALELASSAAAAPGRFPDGVFFVDLGPVADPEQVPRTLAAACGLAPGDSPAGASRTLTDRLVTALARRQCLLLLDNCEHLLDATAQLVDRLLVGCPHLVLLATSRETLGVEGEQTMQVPSLAVPDEGATGAVTDAMRLFADRARAVQASFNLDAETGPAVAEICRRLDGIPLAIEFAAARVAHLSPAQLAERLGDRLRLLTGGRGRMPRQQTLAAVLTWSHGLLSAPEQILFRRLAVFAGGFALAAAEGVCGDDGHDDGDGDGDGGGQPDGLARTQVLNLLGSLVAKSLMTVGQAGQGAPRGEVRYRLLETVRMYALEKLDEADEARRLRSRHRSHHLAWLEAIPLERAFFEMEAIHAIGREIDNLRAATDWCAADDRPDLLVRLVVPMVGYSVMGNSYRVAIALLEGALRSEDRLSTEARIGAHAALAHLCAMPGDVPAVLAHSTQAIELTAGQVSHFSVYAKCYRGFSNAMRAASPGADADWMQSGRRDAAQAVSDARGALAGAWLAVAQVCLGHVEMLAGNWEAAAQCYGEAVVTCSRDSPRSWVMPWALSSHTGALHLLGRLEEAAQTAQRALALTLPTLAYSAVPFFSGVAIEVTPALVAGGAQALADQELRRGAHALRRNGVDRAPNHFLGMAAVVEFLRGQPGRAARLLGAARAVGGVDKEAVQFPSPVSLAYYLHYQPRVRAALGPDEARRARDEGRAMTLDEAFDYALAGTSG